MTLRISSVWVPLEDIIEKLRVKALGLRFREMFRLPSPIQIPASITFTDGSRVAQVVVHSQVLHWTDLHVTLGCHDYALLRSASLDGSPRNPRLSCLCPTEKLAFNVSWPTTLNPKPEAPNPSNTDLKP